MKGDIKTTGLIANDSAEKFYNDLKEKIDDCNKFMYDTEIQFNPVVTNERICWSALIIGRER